MKAKALMILGTGSDVGKSVIAAGFCRILSDWGYRVAPFKAQNMSNNSFVTKGGSCGEMGRAQVVQAECARVEPHPDMNPILLKPSQDRRSQVVVQGRAVGHMDAREYYQNHERMLEFVRESYERLSNEYEILVIEGAGSCAEMNLQDHDLVNLKMAEMADAACLLVGDIDRGGIFASLIGTLQLLSIEDRSRIQGLIINKFRGDPSLFKNGIEILESHTGKKVWGMLPYDHDLWIEAEDSVPLAANTGSRPKDCGPKGRRRRDDTCFLDIAIIRLPRISNFTDFEMLKLEPGVTLRYLKSPRELGNPDLLILPGTKSTIDDLLHLKKTGWNQAILNYFDRGGKILGVCGGYQMMGEWILDPRGVESEIERVQGLGIFKMTTRFAEEKILKQVEEDLSVELFGAKIHGKVQAYEIHMGQSRLDQPYPAFGNGGAIHPAGRAAGTYYHGLFESGEFRRSFLSALQAPPGSDPGGTLSFASIKELHYQRLADLLKNNLDLSSLTTCLHLPSPTSLI